MDVRHADDKLRRLEFDRGYTAGQGRPIVEAFRKKMEFIRAARDERDFMAWKSLRYKKLKGSRGHQRSMRLNDQFRLIVEIEATAAGNRVVIVGIEDYH